MKSFDINKNCMKSKIKYFLFHNRLFDKRNCVRIIGEKLPFPL